jgi:hypothetical protein
MISIGFSDISPDRPEEWMFAAAVIERPVVDAMSQGAYAFSDVIRLG